MLINESEPQYLAVEERNGVMVASFKEHHLGDDQNIEQLGRDMSNLAEQYGRGPVVLDLQDVQFVSSSILGKLITLHRKIHRNGGKLFVCGERGDVAEVLVTSKLINYFNMVEGVEQAIEQAHAV